MPLALPEIAVVEGTQLSDATLNEFDSTVFVFTPEFVKEPAAFSTLTPSFMETMRRVSRHDRAFGREVGFSVHAGTDAFPGGVVVTSPTGPLTRDHDDVRRYADAASRGIKRVRQAGLHRPLLVLQPPETAVTEDCDPLQDYSRFWEVALLAALAEADEALQSRETDEKHLADTRIDRLGVLVPAGGDSARVNEAVVFARSVEEGRRLARDVGGSDPERMTALRAGQYIRDYFAATGGPVTCSIVTDPDVLTREYPLLMAVARASMVVPRHAPCVVELEYRSPDQSLVEEELHLVGKGVTYDTGGADLKVGGNMVGMSRDKCGAAAVAGFVATAALLRPLHVNISARLAFVRNSIGPDAYVSDEIVRSRAGVRVRVGNTDAEGRMAMTDLLARAKEHVLSTGTQERARLLTVATLTGHAIRTYGPYVAALDNAAARRRGVATRLFRTSLATGDPFELSTLRREDFKIVAPTDACEDVLQANRHPSVATSRGHQYPMAFMVTAAGLTAPKAETEGSGADASKIAYTHLDIAGAAEEAMTGGLGRCTGSPIPTLTAAFLLKRFATKLLP